MVRFARFFMAAAAAVLVLAGCASTYKLDNQVQSFSHLPAMPAQPSYRFERSLSQQADPAQQALEALADPALHRAGLRRDDSAPRYSVQVSARTERSVSPTPTPGVPGAGVAGASAWAAATSAWASAAPGPGATPTGSIGK
ncbi:DUF4136 domain-containing protein [Ramlibacter montanisoli]|uniref:DUF4136 domain-containing protein n=1 Tax=Ramlibacter montanisoli TaxID=2732512 RepID=UPI00209C0EDB|nr:DUF4136 domain-containing protein [Ramlibacter montanisoli]